MSACDSPRPIWVGGQWIQSRAARFEDVTDPTTNAVIARVPMAEAEDVDAAVCAALNAFPAWRDTPSPRRAALMFELQRILLREQDDLARLVSQEHGKVVSDAKGSVRRAIDMVEFACGIPTLLQGRTVEDVSSDIDCSSWRQPLGVCAAVCPFNFPIMVPMWFAPIAIACGNAFVLKPSEKTPLTSLRLAELFHEAGFPAGVFNVVTGGREAVDALLEHARVRAISFVGSTPVARYVYETAARHGKRVQALAGAKNHLVALPDADLEATVAALISGAFGSAGERCMAVSACVAVGDIGDALVDALVDASRHLKVGPGIEPDVEMGPLVTKEHMKRVLNYIDQGEREGATLRLDGRGFRVAGYPDGNWVGPTIFDHVTPDMTIYRDEIFGPVLSVLRAETLDDAIAIINANPYGNGTAIFTDSGLAARKFRHEVQVGMVGINVPIPVPMAFFPFAGWRDSFFGTLHAHGRDGVEFYTEQKVVTSRWLGAGQGSQRRMSI